MVYVLIDPDQILGMSDSDAGVSHLAQGILEGEWVTLDNYTTLCGKKINDLSIGDAQSMGENADETLANFTNSYRTPCRRCEHIIRRKTRE